MVQLILDQSQFVNNKYTFAYGNREALFTIVDEEFAGNNTLGRINRITVLVRILDKTGKESGARICTTVIGLGDGVVGIKSEDGNLRGKLLNKDNMDRCVIILYEDDDNGS
jgi:hypothetical protein